MTQTIESRPGSGIARKLASQRHAAIGNLLYSLELDLPADPAATICGRVIITFDLASGASFPVIDFAPAASDAEVLAHIEKVSVNGAQHRFLTRQGHLLIDAPRAAGRQRVEIDFAAGTPALTRRAGLAYTLFVPARAHTVFPCFDQPDLKAPLELTLTLPADWTATANAPAIERAVQDNRARIRFAPSAPLPSYLYAWAAGELHAEERTIGRHRLRLLCVGHSDALDRNRDDILALHAQALDTLEDYTGIPYPFAQFSFVLIPDFPFGGMEHPGAIFYRRSLLLLDQDAGEPERLRRANLIAHETAHIWFGDLVTMPWFDDVWLKEVFANFMADRLTRQAFPALDHELEFLLKHFPPAYAIDRTRGTHAIRQPLDNLDAAGELYDALIYHKAPIALANLEAEIGEAALQSGVRAYLQDFRFGNADWPALVTHIQRETHHDLGSWSRTWIETAGLPPAGPIDWNKPEYGDIVLTETDRIAALDLLEHDAAIDGAQDRLARRRASSWLALYEDMLDGGIDATRLLAAALQVLRRDIEPLLLTRVRNDLSEIYWRRLTVVQRGAAAAAVERTLRRRAMESNDDERRLFWLAALIGIAQTPETIAELDAVWRAGSFGSVTLPEALATRLTLMLALHRPDCAAELTATQIAKTADRDRRARLEFLAPAVAAERATRDAFFERLLSGAGRELWAVAGVGWLSHALRAESALHYLRPGMAHAARLRDQGHIFLPRQWLEALFRGHGSQAAADIVIGFLADNDAKLPPRLRQLILQTADPVLRAAAHS